MKYTLPLHPVLNLAVLGFLLALSCGLGRAQTPVAQRLDVYFGEASLLPVDGAIDSFSATPDGIIKVDKSDASPNQLSIVGLAGGSTVLTVKSGDRTLVYDVAVSPAPVRLYINLNESKRLTFPGPIDDEWNQTLPPPKITPKRLAADIVETLRGGAEDAFPGDIAQDWLARWRDNPKALERELAAQQT